MGGKSKDKKRIEDLEAERDHWRTLAQERGATIGELQVLLERMTMYARAFSGGIDAEIARLQVERNEAIELLNDITVRIYPIMEVVSYGARRERMPDEDWSKIVLSTGDREITFEKNNTTIAAVVAAIYDDETGQVYTQGNVGSFSGTIDEFKDLVYEHGNAIANKGPVLSDRQGGTLESFGIDRRTQILALNRMSLGYFNESAAQQRTELFNTVFAEIIEPNLDNPARRNDARQVFKEWANATFEAMAQLRQMRVVPFKGKGGRPEKNPSKNK